MVTQNLVHVVFKEMELVWLKSIWDSGETIRLEMIEIVIMLPLLKIRH